MTAVYCNGSVLGLADSRRIAVVVVTRMLFLELAVLQCGAGSYFLKDVSFFISRLRGTGLTLAVARRCLSLVRGVWWTVWW